MPDFELDGRGVYRARLLLLPWLDHGFASRHAAGWPGPYVSLRQIHSDRVAVVPGSDIVEGDALVAHTPGTMIGVRTADCVPILLADPETRRVAAIHAGWRGSAARIAAKALERLGAKPEQVLAAIGPAIGECCYEVGPEVAQQFGRQGGVRLDLPGENRAQLMDAGMLAGNIAMFGGCTRCDAVNLHSYRRDKDRSGRMVAAIGVRHEKSADA